MLVQGKVITIWSSRGNMGTTFTAINLAKRLSQYKGKTILVDLNLIQPRVAQYLDFTDKVHTIDNLSAYALGNSLSSELVEANCEKKDNLYVLKGTLNPSFTEFMKPEIISKIIDILKETFSYIVIDTCSFLNNSGTYMALEKSDEVYTLINKDVFSILSLNDYLAFIFETFTKSKFKILFNQSDDKVLISKEEILESLNMECIGELPLINNIFNIINKGDFHKLENKKEARNYYEEIDRIIKNNITSDEILQSKKKKFFSILGN